MFTFEKLSCKLRLVSRNVCSPLQKKKTRKNTKHKKTMVKIVVVCMPGQWWYCNFAAGKKKRKQLESENLVQKNTRRTKKRVG